MKKLFIMNPTTPQPHNPTTPQPHNPTTPQFSWLKHIFYIMLVCVPLLNVFAQQTQTHYYYIEESSYDKLKPTKITKEQDGTVTLEFADSNNTDFFEDFKIYSYVREFGFSRFSSLHKYYLIGLDKINEENKLLLNTNIVSAEYAGTIEDIEGIPLNTPDDYFVDSVIGSDWLPDGSFGPDGDLTKAFQQFNIRGFEHLELINARRAWNITTGDPNVVIGVRDVFFNTIHPEVANKVVATYGAVNSSGEHGLSIAGVAAGDTNLIDEQDNVMIKLTHSTNGIFYNYILDNTQDSIDIDLTNFNSGQYIVNLISGGQILDTQNLIIN